MPRPIPVDAGKEVLAAFQKTPSIDFFIRVRARLIFRDLSNYPT
jgi:hypothetical protein